MSFYSGVPGSGATNNPNQGPIAGPAPGITTGPNSNADLIAGLDMDMSLTMDFDLGLPDTATNPPFQQLPQQRHISQVPVQPMQHQQLQQPRQSNGAPYSSHSSMMDHSAGPMPGAGSQEQSTTSGPGAGPLPHTFGAPPPTSGSTVTEFTKRRNWSQRIIEELKDFLHILTADGRIIYASPSAKTLTGYEPQMLVGKFIGEYVHPDDSTIFMREFNESIASGNALRFFYRFKKEDGTYTIFECDGHPHMVDEGSPSGFDPGTGMQSSNRCRGFFMMARPYPTKNAALLDTFLGHKIENERLMKRIEELKREAAKDDTTDADRTQETTNSESQAVSRVSDLPENRPEDYEGMPPPAKPTISKIALTQQNLESSTSGQRPDSMADKMSRYEANSAAHLESIELLTGLDYRKGERSHGISTGDQSPALVRGDAGIAILIDRDRDGNKKDKKKLKLEDEYVCSDCGTLDSPEWRKGPKGPKTLCNACGLRWAKKEKKGTSSNTSPASLLQHHSTGSSTATPASGLSQVTMMQQGP